MDNMELEKMPEKIYLPFKQLEKNPEPRSFHDLLLVLGEGFLDYLIAFLFGEYKSSGMISEALEIEFYRNAQRNISVGIKAGFLRLLIKMIEQSLFKEQISQNNSYVNAGRLAQTFDLMKKVIDDGADAGFSELVETLRKGRTVKQIGLNEFYNYFVQIRNLARHPEGKAGKKESPRDWPLNEEYYELINNDLHQALTEIIQNFTILEEYQPAIINEVLTDKKQASISLETKESSNPKTINLTSENFKGIVIDERYIIDKTNAIYAKLYLNQIPPINPEIAEKIIKQEKAKIEEPRLRETIGQMLNDSVIDNMEYFVLQDTAKRANISEERLKQLIEGVKNKLKIEKKLDEILIESKSIETKPILNPWWLKYFSMLDLVDGNKVGKQREQFKKIEEKISNLKLKKKNIPVKSKILLRENRIKDLNKKFREDQKNNNDKLSKQLVVISADIKKIKNEDKNIEKIDKLILKKNDLISIFEKKKEDINGNYFKQKEAIELEIKELDNKKYEEEKNIDQEISKITIPIELKIKQGQWATHKQLWQELNAFFQSLADKHLNQESDQESNENKKWVIKANEWQIGNLAHYYWGQLYNQQSVLGSTYSIGVQLRKMSFAGAGAGAWRPSGNLEMYKANDVLSGQKRGVPHFCIEFSTDLKVAQTFDPQNQLGMKQLQLLDEFREENSVQLAELDAQFQVDSGFYPMKNFNDHLDEVLNQRNKLKTENLDIKNYYIILSPLWCFDDFCDDDGIISNEKIYNVEKIFTAFIKLYSNIINDLNDYAMQIGINKETIEIRKQKIKTIKDLMFENLKKTGEEIHLGGETYKKMKEMASEFGIGEALFTSIVHSLRGQLKAIQE